jgi:hypothetical protein
VTVVDRDGRILTGRAATRLILTRLPATFPIAVLMSTGDRRVVRAAAP